MFFDLDVEAASHETNIHYLTKHNFDSKVSKDSGLWLVCCYATWSAASSEFADVYSHIASKRGINYAKLDVGKWSDMAKQLKVATTELPTLILFKNGKEEQRLSKIQGTDLNATKVITHFDLEKRIIDSKKKK